MTKIKHNCEAVKTKEGYSCELCNKKFKHWKAKECSGWCLLETAIENKFVEYVESFNDMAPKYEVTKGDPDRIVLIAPDHFFFIEFKRKGEQPSPLQISRHKLLRGKGYAVHCTSSLSEAKEIYNNEKKKYISEKNKTA